MYRQEARGLQLRGHVRELLLDRLVLGDRLAKGLALLGIADRRFERGSRHADCSRRDVDAPDLECAEDPAEPVPEPVVPTEHAVRADAMAVVDHLDGLDALVPELADVLRHGDAAEARTGVLLDDEAGDALVGLRRERDDPG